MISLVSFITVYTFQFSTGASSDCLVYIGLVSLSKLIASLLGEMAPLAPIIEKAHWFLAAIFGFYGCVLMLLATNNLLQRQWVIYDKRQLARLTSVASSMLIKLTLLTFMI